MGKQRDIYLMILLVVVAVAARVGLHIVLQTKGISIGKYDSDSAFYLHAGRIIAQTWHGHAAAWPVLPNTYPYVVAVVDYLGGGSAMVAAANGLLIGIGIWALLRTLVLLSPQATSLTKAVTGIPLAIFPSLVLSGAEPMKDSAVVAATALFVYAIMGWLVRQRLGYLIVAVAISAVLAGLRVYAVFPFGVGMFVVSAWWASRQEWRMVTRALSMFFLIGLGLMLSGQGYWGSTYALQFSSVRRILGIQTRVFGHGQSSFVQSARPKTKVTTTQHPTQAVVATVKQAEPFVFFGPYVWKLNQYSRTEQLAMADLVLWYPLMGLVILGIVRRKQTLGKLFGAAGGLSLLVVLGVVVNNAGALVRYRAGALPLLLICGGLACEELLQRRPRASNLLKPDESGFALEEN